MQENMKNVSGTSVLFFPTRNNICCSPKPIYLAEYFSELN